MSLWETLDIWSIASLERNPFSKAKLKLAWLPHLSSTAMFALYFLHSLGGWDLLALPSPFPSFPLLLFPSILYSFAHLFNQYKLNVSFLHVSGYSDINLASVYLTLFLFLREWLKIPFLDLCVHAPSTFPYPLPTNLSSILRAITKTVLEERN